MGLLSEGTPLAYEEASTGGYNDYVKRQGVAQFLATYRQHAARDGDSLTWGDEIEYMLVQGGTRLSTRAPSLIPQLDRLAQEEGHDSVWHPEYANWMLEGTPANPFGPEVADLLTVQPNMTARRQFARQQLQPDEDIVSICTFPLTGVDRFMADWPEEFFPGCGDVSTSLYIPDQAINPHPRFPTLTQNIRKRRGSKVEIPVPLYQDVCTPEFKVQEQPVIDMDCMAFGMGGSCLQVTMQAQNLDHARFLYDSLAVVCPIMLALSAATPIWKGRLAGTDTRWHIIEAAVDDRTAAERSAAQQGQGLHKSRYSPLNCFLSTPEGKHSHFSDKHVELNQEALQALLSAGIDPQLARHVAHLFARDPLVVYKESLQFTDTENSVEFFENLNSTNWNSMRLKVPPPGSPIGWRVEFRPMEVQLSDFENAAYSIFVILLAKALTAQRPTLYMPISSVDDNMERAKQTNAATQGSFHWRRSIFAEGCSSAQPRPTWAPGDSAPSLQDDTLVEMSMDEIINGSQLHGTPGLLQLVEDFLDSSGCEAAVRAQLQPYLSLISDRAAGKLQTAAAWQRDLVRSHPEYKADSVVSPSICAALMEEAAKIGHGESSPASLLPSSTGPTLQQKGGQVQASVQLSPLLPPEVAVLAAPLLSPLLSAVQTVVLPGMDAALPMEQLPAMLQLGRSCVNKKSCWCSSAAEDAKHSTASAERVSQKDGAGADLSCVWLDWDLRRSLGLGLVESAFGMVQVDSYHLPPNADLEKIDHATMSSVIACM